jgi:hypothetical protein
MSIVEDYKQILKTKKPPKTSRNYGKSEYLAPATVANKIQTIKCFLKYCNLIHEVGMDYRRIETPRVKYPIMEHIDREQF